LKLTGTPRGRSIAFWIGSKSVHQPKVVYSIWLRRFELCSCEERKGEQGQCPKIKLEISIDVQTGASYDWFTVACTPAECVLVGWAAQLVTRKRKLPTKCRAQIIENSGEWATVLTLRYCSSAAFPSPGPAAPCWRSIWKSYGILYLCKLNVPQTCLVDCLLTRRERASAWGGDFAQ
jgi:hypothetical protein